MRVCLMVEGQEGVSWSEWLALAEACEQAGLEGMFRSDHYLSVLGRRDRGSLDAWTTLAGLAARTERIRLGVLVSPATFRHPSVLAKSAVTVDHVSAGRVELGLGAGWNEPEHRAYGFPFPVVAERFELLEEQLEIVRRLLGEGDDVTFAGAHYRLDACPALPKPVQQRLSLIVGGSAGPRSIGLAARFADEYNTLLASEDDCRERKQRIVAACGRLQRDPATLPLSLMATCVAGESRAELLARVQTVLSIVGSDDRDPEGVLAERAERWIAGTPDEIVERLRRLETAGVERVFLQHLAHRDLEMIELLGRVAATVG